MNQDWDGPPKGQDFFRPQHIPNLRLMPQRQPEYQGMEQQPNQNFLMWLLQKLRGGMWGQPDLPDQQLDGWLKREMERPRGSGFWV